MFVQLKRIFHFGWLNFKRHLGLSVATIFILLLTVSLLTSLFLFQRIVQFSIDAIKEKVEISVYLKQDVSLADILRLKEELLSVPQVKEVKLVSREEALERFTERHKENTVLMEALKEVGDNPFLASLNIRAVQPENYSEIVDFLEKELPADLQGAIEKIDYYQRKPVIEKIFQITGFVNRTGVILAIILAILASLVIFNQVRLSIYSQREELIIQRLVGASNWFIRGPFLVHGAICGFLAALICFGIFIVLCWFVEPKLEMFFPGLNLFTFFIRNMSKVLLFQVIAGVGLGVISSGIAVRRYLKI